MRRCFAALFAKPRLSDATRRERRRSCRVIARSPEHRAGRLRTCCAAHWRRSGYLKIALVGLEDTGQSNSPTSPGAPAPGPINGAPRP